ncbi:FAD-dependent oxidoreductase [Allopusillimonas soli]|uniref:FAD-dependent monooxygenase n=1 Tax=Allopusillimonas soli TaxID=659016 RepID=A0A853FHJ4_9BURK|nr:FAD-dependent monooxygenase [Allopusillimonas soli]NYT37456.1 FAD-dependent monooxygenase [Allopusillimonas soli]TEA74563.1 FAD-dependent oxidoreductase [Allopusillimonas soli]
MPHSSSLLPEHATVVIAGGGPVGLSLAALLAEYGIASLTIEADEGYCTGSRAICMSRRSQEILGWFGADTPLVAKGLGWTSGRSYFRNQEVLHFEMPHDPAQRFDPMVNIQQYYVEEYAHDAMRRHPELARISWASRVTAVRNEPGGVAVRVENKDGDQWVNADWLVACDGGRSAVRDALGLVLEGRQYEGRYVIVDIEQASQRRVERLAWFDPPSNPGSTILMHRQPDDVWRIDYQVGDDEDPQEAVKPENVLPRVQSHLDMMGETAPWKPLWISIYNAKCLSLDSYRHGRVLFAGDAAHLVPIFGVRGLNSGLDDAGNLAWKLAWVIRGAASEVLLDSYSSERVHAARQNMAYGAKSTEFMAPPSYGYTLMRDAALRLGVVDATVRALVNPRQSEAVSYDGSPLNAADGLANAPAESAPGKPAPDLKLTRAQARRHLSQSFGRGFVMLGINLDEQAWRLFSQLEDGVASMKGLPATVFMAVSDGANESGALEGRSWRVAHDGLRAYGSEGNVLYLLRPDGYIQGRWPASQAQEAGRLLASFYSQPLMPD